VCLYPADHFKQEMYLMSLLHWLRSLQSWPFRATAGKDRLAARPRLEVLEGRHLPSTFTVLNTNDSGPGSLRAEIAAAQSGDRITFDPSLSGQGITLASGQLVLDRSVDIEGPRPSATPFLFPLAVVSNGTDRVFDIQGGATVTLAGLAIVNGTANQGGDIYNAGSLTLTGCVVQGGIATGSADNPGMGGGIDNADGGSLTISHSFIESNAAVFTVVLNPDLTESLQGANEQGGGIYEAGGTVRIDNSTFQLNQVQGVGGTGGPGSSLGGAIYIAGGSLQVANCSLEMNTAGEEFNGPPELTPSAGGAIYQAGGTVAVKNSLFLNNVAGSGDASAPGQAPFTAQGGAIYLAAGSLTLTNDRFFGNATAAFDAQGAGGAIYQVSGSLSMTNCRFSNNAAQAEDFGGGGDSAEGGAIYVAGGSLSIQSCYFNGNDVFDLGPGPGIGGAIYIAGGSVCISKNTTFTGDFASTSSPDIFGSFTVC
jgi:hypothetical protein